MIRTGRTRAAIVVGAVSSVILLAGAASAQEPGRYGARVGNTYLPSTHDSNCGGILCSSLPTDPANPTRVVPPPSCEGLMCSMTPYGMQRPYTAADAERDRAAARAQAAAPLPAEPAAPTRRSRKVRKAKMAKARIAKAARTPAPAEPAQ